MTADLAGLWESIQSEPVFWLLLLAGAVVAVFLAAVTSGSHDYPRRNPGDDLAEYHDLDAVAHCGHSNGALVCDRAPGHEGPHVDSRSGLTHPVKWIDGELGMRSVDEIRREYGTERHEDHCGVMLGYNACTCGWPTRFGGAA